MFKLELLIRHQLSKCLDETESKGKVLTKDVFLNHKTKLKVTNMIYFKKYFFLSCNLDWDCDFLLFVADVLSSKSYTAQDTHGFQKVTNEALTF